MKGTITTIFMAACTACCGLSSASAADLANGNFDASTSGWSIADNWTSYKSGGTAYWYKNTSIYRSSPNAQRLRPTDSGSGAYCGVYQNVSAAAGDAVTFVAWAYNESPSSYITSQLGVQFDGSNSVPSSWQTNSAKQAWTSLTVGGKATTASNGVTVFLRAVRGSSGQYYANFDDVVEYIAYVPPAPTVSNPSTGTLDVDVNPGNNSTNSNAQYAISIGGGSYILGTHWVQANGTINTTAVWQTDTTWGTKTVSGLTAGVGYTFQVMARFSSTYAQETDLGAGANASTNCNSVAVPTDAAASTNPICSGSQTTLSATPGTGNEVWWFTGSCGGTQVGTSAGNQIVSPSTTTTYYARNKLSGTNCWSSTCAEVTITVIPPATINAGGPYTGCVGSAVNIAGTVTNATNPVWSTSGHGTFANANALTTTYTPSADDVPGVTLTLTADGTSPCPVVQSNTTVTVNAQPACPVAGSTIASNSSITWNWSAANGATSYTLADSWGNRIITGITNTYFTENGLDLSLPYTCFVQASNSCGTCGGWTPLTGPSLESSLALLQNGGMEAFTVNEANSLATGWTLYSHGKSPASWSLDISNRQMGRYSQKLHADDNSGPPITDYCGLRQTVSANPGDAFTFTAYGRTFHNNTTYAGLFIGAQWNGSTTPPMFNGNGQGGNSFFPITAASGNATGNTVTVFLHAQTNGHAGDDQLVWFDNAVGYRVHLPPAPTVSNPTSSTLDVTIDPGLNLANPSIEYAISIGEGAYTLGSNWVQMDGTVGTTPAWQTETGWGTAVVNGLDGGITYKFKVAARYSSSIPQSTLLGAEASGTTSCPGIAAPTNAAVTINPPPAENLTVPQEGAIAYFVAHGSNATSASLPANGGTVVVDLVIATTTPLIAWNAMPTVNAENIISIDATGWTAKEELLTWAGLSTQAMPSHYNCAKLNWVITNAQSRIICQSTVQDGACANRALEEGAVVLSGGSPDLSTLNGPINVAFGDDFVTSAPLGGILTNTLTSGTARVATLTLQVAGTPGTYHLRLIGGSYSTSDSAAAMQDGPAFDIQVGG